MVFVRGTRSVGSGFSRFGYNKDLFETCQVGQWTGKNCLKELPFGTNRADDCQRQALRMNLIQPGSDDFVAHCNPSIVVDVVQFEVTAPCPFKESLNTALT